MLIVAYLAMTINFVGNPLKESSTVFCICEESVYKAFLCFQAIFVKPESPSTDESVSAGAGWE